MENNKTLAELVSARAQLEEIMETFSRQIDLVTEEIEKVRDVMYSNPSYRPKFPRDGRPVVWSDVRIRILKEEREKLLEKLAYLDGEYRYWSAIAQSQNSSTEDETEAKEQLREIFSEEDRAVTFLDAVETELERWNAL